MEHKINITNVVDILIKIAGQDSVLSPQYKQTLVLRAISLLAMRYSTFIREAETEAESLTVISSLDIQHSYSLIIAGEGVQEVS